MKSSHPIDRRHSKFARNVEPYLKAMAVWAVAGFLLLLILARQGVI